MDESELPLTERINPSTVNLDTLGTADLLHRINDEDRRAAWAVEREIDVIAAAVDAIAERVRAGGKLHYFGAGTSGRIAVLDAAEIPPTFSVDGMIVAHIAGGGEAVLHAVEAAEDDAQAGSSEVTGSGISSSDAVIGISASGTAAYVLGAIEAARAQGALTVGLFNDPDAPLARAVHIPIVLRTGPEVIAGSTRMKAASAQKMTLTMISTALMIKLGKVYDNLMIDLAPTNAKLRARARRLVERLTQSDPAEAGKALEAARYNVKTAVVMLRCRCDVAQAQTRLVRAGGNLREVIDGSNGPP